MTDNEKNDLKTGIITIFDKFNILDHTFTIGGLRDKILSFINSIKEESAGSDFETEWENYFRYKGDMATVNIKDLAKHFVEWQKERDKQWLSEEHKHIFAKGRDSMKQQIMNNAVDGAYIKRQELSKKDEAVLDALIRRLEGEDIYVSPHLAVECLKSIRHQLQWKPSEEQMETLEYYMHTLFATDHKEVLFGLYNDLKQL